MLNSRRHLLSHIVRVTVFSFLAQESAIAALLSESNKQEKKAVTLRAQFIRIDGKKFNFEEFEKDLDTLFDINGFRHLISSLSAKQAIYKVKKSNLTDRHCVDLTFSGRQELLDYQKRVSALAVSDITPFRKKYKIHQSVI